MPAAAGIDLAPRHSAICVVPDDWDWRVESLYLDCFEFGVLGKLDVESRIKLAIVASQMVVHTCQEKGVEVAGVENYAFRRGMSQSATMLAEIGGIVRSQLFLETGSCPLEVNAATARKFLTGGTRMKRRDDEKNGVSVLKIKDQICLFLENRGFSFDSEDKTDAFVVAYYVYCKHNHFRCKFDRVRPEEQVNVVR